MGKKDLPVEDLSIDIQLEHRTRSYSFGESRGGGGFAKSVPKLQARLASIRTDAAAIAEVIAVVEQFEQASTTQTLNSFGKIIADPLYVASEGKIAQMTKAQYKIATAAGRSGFKAGKQTVLQIQVDLIDELTAAAQYQVYDATNALMGSAAATLGRSETGGGWQVLVYAQHPTTE